jgi:hypothetical protein
MPSSCLCETGNTPENVACTAHPKPWALVDRELSAQQLGSVGPSRVAAPLRLPSRDCMARSSTSLVRKATYRLAGDKHVVQHPGEFAIDERVNIDMLHYRPAGHSQATGHDPWPARVAPARWTSAGE